MTTVTKKAHPIKDLLSGFDAAFRQRFGQPYRVLGGRDAKLAEQLLRVYAYGDLCRWMDAFFASHDPFISSSTYSFAVFASCLGKLIAAESQQPTLSEKSARTLKTLYGRE